MGGRTDFETAVNQLYGLLSDSDVPENRERLVSIASRIEIKARELIAEHSAFTDSFEKLLLDFNTSVLRLNDLVETHQDRRRVLRDELLHLQDELRLAMSPEEWLTVLDALNEASEAISAYTLTGA